MLTPEEFLSKWDAGREPLIQFDRSILDRFWLPDEARAFLGTAGLPKSAAPSLSFSAPTGDGLFRLLADGFPMGHLPIGRTGNGGIVCVREGTGEVLVVDHEEPANRTPMNASVRQLLECLLEYGAFIAGVRAGDLAKRLKEIDAAAMAERAFWRGIADGCKEQAEPCQPQGKNAEPDNPDSKAAPAQSPESPKPIKPAEAPKSAETAEPPQRKGLEHIFTGYGIEIYRRGGKHYILADLGEIVAEYQYVEATEAQAARARRSGKDAGGVLEECLRRDDGMTVGRLAQCLHAEGLDGYFKTPPGRKPEPGEPGVYEENGQWHAIVPGWKEGATSNYDMLREGPACSRLLYRLRTMKFDTEKKWRREADLAARFEGETLYAGGNRVDFAKPIREMAVFEFMNAVVVLLESGSPNNIFGVDGWGRVIWQVQDAGNVYSFRNDDTYVGIRRIDGSHVRGATFGGLTFDIDVSSGKVVNKD